MTAVAIEFSKESPAKRVARLVGTAVVKHVRSRPPHEWPEEDRHIARACINFIAFGIESRDSQQHTNSNRLRFIRLSQKQSDALICFFLEATWDEPLL